MVDDDDTGGQLPCLARDISDAAPDMPPERHHPQICMYTVLQIAAVRLCYSNRLRQIDTVACVSYAIVFLLITFVTILLCTHW